MSRKVYDITFNFNNNSGASRTATFDIESPGREMKIKSILLNILCYQTVSNQIIPNKNNTTQFYYLVVGQAGNSIAYPFANLTGLVPSINGERFRITEPGQYFFDSFFASNNLGFALSVSNNEPVADCTYEIAIVVETEEKTVFIK